MATQPLGVTTQEEEPPAIPARRDSLGKTMFPFIKLFLNKYLSGLNIHMLSIHTTTQILILWNQLYTVGFDIRVN
jgi:hypothetical protein